MKFKTKLRRYVFKRIPIVKTICHYTFDDVLADIVAGITIGLTLIPQAIAYAALAGLSPQYGLYTALAGSIIYSILGTCTQVSVGPTAVLSLLTINYTNGLHPGLSILLAFLAGCVQFACAILRLGFVVDFVSTPVTVGFTSAAALIIASSQVKGLLGLKFEAHDFIETWREVWRRIPDQVRLGDALLALCCCVILLFMRKLKDIKIDNSEGSKRKAVLKKLLWFTCVGRNASVVVISSTIAYFVQNYKPNLFLLTGNIEPGLPEFHVPEFSVTYSNSTHEFKDMVSQLGSGIVVVPLVALIQNIAIAKAFANGKAIDAIQEMIALGACNLLGSFIGSYPACGSFSRGAVSSASGVKTPANGLWCSLLVIMALIFLTPYFYFIPKATLSSVLICAVIFMIDVTAIKDIWKTRKWDSLPLFATFFFCLILGVEMGIIIGVIVDMCFLLYYSARPKVLVEKIMTENDIEYILVTPTSGMAFPSVDYIRYTIAKTCNKSDDIPIVFNCHFLHNADYTTSQGMLMIAKDFQYLERPIIFHCLNPHVEEIITATNNSSIIKVSTDLTLLTILKSCKEQFEYKKQLESYQLESERDEKLSSL